MWVKFEFMRTLRMISQQINSSAYVRRMNTSEFSHEFALILSISESNSAAIIFILFRSIVLLLLVDKIQSIWSHKFTNPALLVPPCTLILSCHVMRIVIAVALTISLPANIQSSKSGYFLLCNPPCTTHIPETALQYLYSILA